MRCHRNRLALWAVGGLLLSLAVVSESRQAPRAAVGSGGATLPAVETAAGWKAQVEADWLNQDIVRLLPGHAVTTREDALGGCDGVKDGKYGFHTDIGGQPWWQVDLGATAPISRVLVYNRCDSPQRAASLELLVSEDGQNWREVYRHDGTPFLGATDGNPLTVALRDVPARFLRVRLPSTDYLHLDEVEVYSDTAPGRNLALREPADQSSVSQWSTRKVDPAAGVERRYPIAEVLARGRRLLEDLRRSGAAVGPLAQELAQHQAAARRLTDASPPSARRELYLKARWTVRRLALANPLLSFDRILFVKRAPGSFSHMSDQHYGWWSRPGGGVYILEGFRTGTPRVRCLTTGFPEGSFLGPDLSYDGRKLLFAYCRYYPEVAQVPDKVTKTNLPEDAFYHVFEMNVDGTALRQVTRGRYDDFDPRYLPNGDILFLSTRRGQFVQCEPGGAMATAGATLPDSYVRCGGDPWRPVAVYTLHVMDARGENLRAISPFENFEWTPSVASDGRILYARWDYVDRSNMPYMSLWSTNPDGTQPQIVYGNFTTNPHCIFEARSVPNSRKLLFTASAHHSITAGSLVLLDPARGSEGQEALTRMTPEVCFPEAEGWPATYFANPYPLSERYALTAWSNLPLAPQGGLNPVNALGIYLCDAFGNLELLYRDPAISSMYPLPLRARQRPPVRSTSVVRAGAPGKQPAPPAEGRFLLLNVYEGLKGVPQGEVTRLRIVGVPAKTQPNMNTPVLGVTGDDPGKFVLGTVPVERDGSAYFRAPAGVPLFFQALNRNGLALQTMRSATYLQSGQTTSCIGCHEPRNLSPANLRPLAASRGPSRITPGPEGAWPLRFDRLVQPVLDRKCVSCHQPGASDAAAARFDLTPAKAYESLIGFGKPSLRDHVGEAYRRGASLVGKGAASTSALLLLLRQPGGHHGAQLDGDSLERLALWMDTYAQRLGSFSDEQERDLERLRLQWADLLERPASARAAEPRTALAATRLGRR